jgi:NAD(P)-dependent dehydrogenase (short-subunit alcohol dehydrogenase family)
MYAMAKSGIEGLLRVVATDYGEFNLRANIVRPGIIMTDRNKRFWMRSDYTNAMNEILPNKCL